jgi:hypothetical protein
VCEVCVCVRCGGNRGAPFACEGCVCEVWRDEGCEGKRDRCACEESGN